MPCLSPFKKYIEDLFEAYDASGPIDDLSTFMYDNSNEIINGNTVQFGIYPTPEYCCPSCDANDPCGNIYYFGSVNQFLKLAEFKSWVANPGSVPCCYNFMGDYKRIIQLEAAMCWSSIPRCCNEFDNCFKTFETVVPNSGYLQLINDGVVEYGSIEDSDNICFLKEYLEERYPGDFETIIKFLGQILKVGLLIVCPPEKNEVWVITAETYTEFCRAL